MWCFRALFFLKINQFQPVLEHFLLIIYWIFLPFYNFWLQEGGVTLLIIIAQSLIIIMITISSSYFCYAIPLYPKRYGGLLNFWGAINHWQQVLDGQNVCFLIDNGQSSQIFATLCCKMVGTLVFHSHPIACWHLFLDFL